MSRIGKMPIQVPAGTKIEVKDGLFLAEGPKGKVAQPVFPGFPVEVKDNVVTISRSGDSGPERSKHGLLRALLANAVHGASAGFVKELDIVGVGYRAEVKGPQVQFALGYSHPVLFDIPEGIKSQLSKSAATQEAAKLVGEVVAERAKAKGIDRVVFDRGGYIYHGNVKAVAEAARDKGLQF